VEHLVLISPMSSTVVEIGITGGRGTESFKAMVSQESGREASPAPERGA